MVLPDLDGDGAFEVILSAPSMELLDTNTPAAGEVYLFDAPAAGEHWLDEADIVVSGTEWLDLGTSIVVSD